MESIAAAPSESIRGGGGDYNERPVAEANDRGSKGKARAAGKAKLPIKHPDAPSELLWLGSESGHRTWNN